MFLEHETKGKPFSALATLVRPLTGVAGQVPLHVGPARIGLITERALELPLGQVYLPMLGPR